MGLTDLDLWERVRAGRVEAFGELFDRYADAICGYCFRRTGDRVAAEDLTSVVFLEAWRRRDEVRFHGDVVRPWLFGVATNVVRNHRRSLRRYRAALERLPRGELGADFAEHADERMDVEAVMKEITALVRRLPLAEREVFALCSWQGLSSSEVADALQVPEATVRTRLFRARERIRAQLSEISPSASRSAEVPYQ